MTELADWYAGEGASILSEVNGSWDDTPIRYHGADPMDREYVYPGRRRALIPEVAWPYTPETCTATAGFWWFDGQVLLCNGCGIDGT